MSKIKKIKESKESTANETASEKVVPNQPFNPNDQLQWQPDDQIKLSGFEFYVIMQTLKPFETAVMVKNAILSRMIQDGTAKRIVPESVETNPVQEVVKK